MAAKDRRRELLGKLGNRLKVAIRESKNLSSGKKRKLLSDAVLGRGRFSEARTIAEVKAFNALDRKKKKLKDNE